MAKISLPTPERVTLSNGRVQYLYRDRSGNFISKAEYEKLRDQQISGSSKQKRESTPHKRSVEPTDTSSTSSIEPNGFEMITNGQLRMTVELPSLISVNEFLSDIPKRLEAISILYLFLSLIQSGKTDLAKDLLPLLKGDNKSRSTITLAMQKDEFSQVIKPLQLIRFHYGSISVTDLLGVPKLLETIVALRERWKKLKYEEELLKRDISLKDEEILTKQAERRGLEIKNFGELITALQKGRDREFSDEELKQLYELSMTAATPFIDPPTYELSRPLNPLLVTDGKENQPQAANLKTTNPINHKKKANRRKRRINIQRE